MTKCILVVDDEATIRELVADALREADYQVRTAANGVLAWQTLSEWLPDAIVLDLMMPLLDASGFIKLLRADARFADVPVLIVTAAYGAGSEAERLGAQAWLSKPFALDDLLARIAALVGDRVSA
ncbi:MAG TPA: response regulator [Chloroflexota bacterium]